jgi:preprotein translocase subunit SecE
MVATRVGLMADFLAVVSVVVFIALFLGYIWCLERV